MIRKTTLKWADIVEDWAGNLARLTARFPSAKEHQLNMRKDNIEDIARYLADAHELTLMEAHEELQDYVMMQNLARDAADIRTRDAALIAAQSTHAFPGRVGRTG